MPDVPIRTRIETLLEALATWQRLAPRVARLLREVESVRQDEKRFSGEELRNVLSLRRSSTALTASEQKDVEALTTALRTFAEHGAAVTAHAHSAGIPSGELAVFLSELDPARISGARQALYLARSVAQTTVTRGAGSPKRPSKIALAIACRSEHPDWTNGQVADVVGCNAKYLSQNQKYKAACKAIKAAGKAERRAARQSRGRDMDEYEDDG